MFVIRGTEAVLAAAKVTKTVPIVLGETADPVETGLVANLAGPGGNLTGLAVNAVDMATKRAQLLKEAVPKSDRVAVLWNSSVQSMTLGFQVIEQTAPTRGVTIQSVRVSGSDEFDQAFAAIERGRPGELIVLFGPLRGDDLSRIVDLTVRQRIPTVFEVGQGVRGGDSWNFGSGTWRMARRAAAYIDKIANGAPPAALPVEQPTVFELITSLKAGADYGHHDPTRAVDPSRPHHRVASQIAMTSGDEPSGRRPASGADDVPPPLTRGVRPPYGTEVEVG